MNEGFSDIWAACAEYFAIKTVDGSLSGVYKPFYIGEQIAADPTIPLRRMDNPKARRHPDTYGGEFWKNPNCSPTLANDYCGVHTNSGVLNKWFYLMTAGSGSGSGDDGAYAGADDGINDKGNAYTVNGLGFAVSERITYLTELMLTSTATFADARNVSVSVATSLSGNPCDNMVESVTNAWYAVGVGDVFVRPCKVTYGFTLQPGSSVSEGKAGAGCNAEIEVKISLVLPANSTATIATAGTATNGTDYRLSATSLSNSGSTIQTLDVSVFVKNDGVIENDETVQLTASISNTGTDNVNSNYTLNIIEDDVTPVIGNESKNIFTETFPVSEGFNSPSNWTKIEEATGSTNKWGVWNGKLQVTAVAHETVPGPGFYDQLSATSTIARSPEIKCIRFKQHQNKV
jgi:Zn-dependent metalloprotease